MASIIIAGYAESDFVPGLVRETKYGQGRVSIGQIPVKLLVTGNKTSAGTATADADFVPIYSYDDADTYAGPGSEGAVQCYAALDIPGVTLYYAPVAAPSSSPAQATLTITIAGTWSTTGNVGVWLAGRFYSVGVGASDTVTTVAANLAAKINSNPRLFCTASPSVGVITLTVRSTGARGNDYVCRKDLTAAPAGMTVALAGGTALNTYMTPFSSGAGADDVTNVLALATTDRWQMQAWAQNDATNAALIRAQMSAEAGPLKQHLGHAIFAKIRGTAASISFAQTTLNDQRCTCVHMTNAEWPAFAVAAQIAALRSVIVGANPNYNYDDFGADPNAVGQFALTIPAQSQKADIAGRSTLDSLLHSGVMPLTTTPSGRVKIVRAIQSHSLNGSSPDYRTLDWGDADVPDRISDEIASRWTTFKQSNPYVGPEPADGQQPAPANVATPSRWNSELYKVLSDAQAANWVQDIDLPENAPLTEYNPTAKRLMSAVPCVVRTQFHSAGVSVRQTAA
jgi:phage tail sheath gpL-like